MTLQEMIRQYAAERDASLRSLEIRWGFGKDALIRLARGAKTMPVVDTIHRLADMLGVRPVEVVLAISEELGTYDPTEDGRLVRRTGIPEEVQSALATVERYVAEAAQRP